MSSKVLFSAIAFSFLLFAKPSVAQNVDQEFQKCVNSSGAIYENSRNILLSSNDGIEFAKTKVNSQDWRERIVAAAVLGWYTDSGTYKQKINGQVGVDQVGNRRYLWAYDVDQVELSLMPLMYEFIYKGIRPGEGYDAASRVAPYLVKQNAAIDLDAMQVSLQDSSLSSLTRRLVSQILSDFPQDQLANIDFMKLLKLEANASAGDWSVGSHLLGGIYEATRLLDDAAKDQINNELLDDVKIKALVGKVSLIHTVGNIGGNKAAEVLKQMLYDTTETDRDWVIMRLVNMGNDSASKTAREFVTNMNSKYELRFRGIDEFGGASFAMDNANTLVEILMNESDKMRLRELAIESLDQMHEILVARHLGGETSLRALILNLNSNQISNRDLRTKVEDFKTTVRGRHP